eukprot:g6915.t1
MAKMYYVGRPAQVNTFAFAQQMSFGSVFGAASNVVYSYAGHWLYFELMAEMERPEQFPRVFLINVPIQVSLYLLVACWGYHFAGDKVLSQSQTLSRVEALLAFRRKVTSLTTSQMDLRIVGHLHCSSCMLRLPSL